MSALGKYPRVNSASVGLERHIVLQAFRSEGVTDGAYMVATECGATLYPRHWNQTLTIRVGTPREEITCKRCKCATARCADDDCNAELQADGTCPRCDGTMPKGYRVPEVMSGWCHYCNRYGRPCGRHED